MLTSLQLNNLNGFYIYVTEIWYNLFMDEKKPILRVIEREETELVQETKPIVSRPNQTSPIYKKLVKFCNEKIGEKFSIRDLLR